MKSVPAQEYVAQHFLNQGDAVSLHMRLGDYANSRRIFAQTNSQLGPGYYRRAIQAMKKKLSTPRFFVFSNDIQ